jgi:hypothetical protein
VTSTRRQITGLVSCNSMRTVAISSKLDILIVDAREHIGEPALWVDFVQACGLDQRVRDGGALAPRLEPANSHDLRPIIAQANPSVIQEAREGGPALEHVVDRLGDFGVPGEFCSLGPHPIHEVTNRATRARRTERCSAAESPLISPSMSKKAGVPGNDSSLITSLEKLRFLICFRQFGVAAK